MGGYNFSGRKLSVTTKALDTHSFDLGDSTSEEFSLIKWKDEKKYVYTKIKSEVLKMKATQCKWIASHFMMGYGYTDSRA